MVKIRKQRKKKSYNYGANRKNMNKKQLRTGHIKCPEVKKEWNKDCPVNRNFKNMGLSNDPNAVLPFRRSQRERVAVMKKSLETGEIPLNVTSNAIDPEAPRKRRKNAPKAQVAEKLEENANALRESGFRFSKGQVRLISYFLDKHKLNYRAMVSDKKNYEQETWKQLRRKVRKFLAIPEHVDEYLKTRGLERLSLEEEDTDSD
ncbi:nucleolar protein 16 [Phlebotomus argentipes]|uniref:nucleolar protein 16 n=1 Tax=Phlebotomus argentipes TaxID=94469 RepID=UPI0028937754|nr:nucleolar protein 16 [Phlebotomus argentipes]